ncbi:MAG TPA: prenyltransferase/squalene oxidase repeat-containing protein [Pirellulales bacterium]|nr:prenyltransferase/squalene oxidase repeat-containing protein [Pirellulales bacterium]
MPFLPGLLLSCAACADEPVQAIEAGRIVEALKRALPIVETAAESYPYHRECFSCHHQTLPMLAMVAAQRRGLETNGKLLAEQAEFTHKSFRESTDGLQKGEGIGGRAMTVGYGLWALRLAERKPDETTAAMVMYLLKTQKAEGHWERQMSRPPLEDSNVTCTVLAAHGMRRHAAETQRAEVDAAVSKAKDWLAQAKVESQEDQVARLWGIDLLGGDEMERKAARETVLASQRDDGGWGQLKELPSDAYATGQTLYILQATGLAPDEPAYRRGAEFLLRTQCEDGSWFVKTRSKPIQEYFDNGDPHGENQFISVPATCWAVAALAAAEP